MGENYYSDLTRLPILNHLVVSVSATYLSESRRFHRGNFGCRRVHQMGDSCWTLDDSSHCELCLRQSILFLEQIFLIIEEQSINGRSFMAISVLFSAWFKFKRSEFKLLVNKEGLRLMFRSQCHNGVTKDLTSLGVSIGKWKLGSNFPCFITNQGKLQHSSVAMNDRFHAACQKI